MCFSIRELVGHTISTKLSLNSHRNRVRVKVRDQQRAAGLEHSVEISEHSGEAWNVAQDECADHNVVLTAFDWKSVIKAGLDELYVEFLVSGGPPRCIEHGWIRFKCRDHLESTSGQLERIPTCSRSGVKHSTPLQLCEQQFYPLLL